MPETTESSMGSYEGDLSILSTALAELALIADRVYQLEGRGVEGAQMKAAAVSIVESVERRVQRRLRRRMERLKAMIVPPEQTTKTNGPPADPGED